jgi:hypothetical protein
MKFAVGILLLLWLLSGLVGAAMLGHLDRDHLKAVARGPITLVKAINENPASIPGASD